MLHAVSSKAMASIPSVEEMSFEVVRDLLIAQGEQLSQLRQQYEVGKETWSIQSRQLAERVDDVFNRIVELENRGLSTPWPGGVGLGIGPNDSPGLQSSVVDQMTARVEELENKMSCWAEREPHDKPNRWDTRWLKLDPYGGDKKTWRAFAFTLKAFIKRACTSMESLMNAVEHGEQEVKEEKLHEYRLDRGEDTELAWILTNYTAGEAKELVQLHEGQLGIEIWRLLTKENDPKSGTSGVQSMQKLMGPSRCRTYADLKKSLVKWDSLLKAEIQRNGPAAKLGPEVKATAIISMVPKPLEEEILKKGKKFVESYAEVRQFVDDMVYMHTMEGSGVAVSNLEHEFDDNEELEIVDEGGNTIIGTIVRKDGKKSFNLAVVEVEPPGPRNLGGSMERVVSRSYVLGVAGQTTSRRIAGPLRKLTALHCPGRGQKE